MTERCNHCEGRGQISVSPRLYEFTPFDALCYVCNGSGMKSFGLDMNGERQFTHAERMERHFCETRIEHNEIYGPVSDFDPYPDEFNIGQDKVARIRMDLALETLQEAAVEAFSTEYENDEWRAMRRRQFEAALPEYRRAQAVLADLAREELGEAA